MKEEIGHFVAVGAAVFACTVLFAAVVAAFAGALDFVLSLPLR